MKIERKPTYIDPNNGVPTRSTMDSTKYLRARELAERVYREIHLPIALRPSLWNHLA